ncbi:hypothetical protein ASD50_05255 [Mesorhizobium sp. Root552]|nr:hypothetical protein ASD50_05255 [Mesorhizobium sp. Root552]
MVPGDVILCVNGEDVADADELRRLIGNLAPHAKVHITALRDGRRIDRDADVSMKISEPALYHGRGLLESVLLAKVTPGSPAYGKVLGAAVVSVDPDSAAASSGLMEVDVIATIDRKPIGGPEQAVRIAADHAGLLLLGIYRDDQMHFVVVRRGNS